MNRKEELKKEIENTEKIEENKMSFGKYLSFMLSKAELKGIGDTEKELIAWHKIQYDKAIEIGRQMGIKEQRKIDKKQITKCNQIAYEIIQLKELNKNQEQIIRQKDKEFADWLESLLIQTEHNKVTLQLLPKPFFDELMNKIKELRGNLK